MDTSASVSFCRCAEFLASSQSLASQVLPLYAHQPILIMSTVIFLGAGASASDGAPVQSDLLKLYFESDSARLGHGDIDTELRTYFWEMFHIDVELPGLDDVKFPTFEEAIGMLDLAEIRDESFKNFDRPGVASNSGRIRKVRNYLVYALASVIKEKTGNANWHRSLVSQLDSQNITDQVSIISTNYDILIDNSLAELLGSDTEPGDTIDYGIEFTNHEYWRRADEGAINLFKIHGSLNWLYCPTCSSVSITPFQKGGARIAEDPGGATCNRCQTLQSTIIIPPTFYKKMSNIFLQNIWRNAEKTLRNASKIIFCGYSFPDADNHIKYLIKRAETNREGGGFDVTVINWHSNKDDKEAELERERYNRFFRNPVDYTTNTFSEFATAPEDFI